MSGDDAENTLREWATQEVNHQRLCIMFLEAQNFKVKSGLIHLLPTFRGLENEDPHKFLMIFHVVCSGMKPHVVTKDQIKLKEFPFFISRPSKGMAIRAPIRFHSHLDCKVIFRDFFS